MATMYISQYGILPVMMIFFLAKEVGNPHDPSTVVVTKVFQQACHVETNYYHRRYTG